MSFTKLIFGSIIVLLTLSASKLDQDTIELSIQTANSKELAKYFDKNVEITILDKEAVYSKVQAEQVIRDFFNKNKVKEFAILHKGSSKANAQYCIGKLKTINKAFRVYIYFAAEHIQELRFEEE